MQKHKSEALVNSEPCSVSCDGDVTQGREREPGIRRVQTDSDVRTISNLLSGDSVELRILQV